MTFALVSTRGQYDRLLSFYAPIATGVFALLLFVIVVALIRTRRGAGHARRDDWPVLEGSYAAILACVAAFLLYLTFGAEHQVDTVANRERPSLVVNVTAARWEWSFAYPGYGIQAESGVVGHEPLVVPADEAIRFNLASQDVIHAFYVPELDFKRDLIHGRVEHVTLSFTRLGDFKGQCAEYCGLRHAEMIFDVHVLSPARFTAWLDAHRVAGSRT